MVTRYSNKETQLFMTEGELRFTINGLYDTVQSEKDGETFDIMLLREIRGQLFWNCIFYFTLYSLPYDGILPYSQMHELSEFHSKCAYSSQISLDFSENS